jgi:thiol-disulfide isomerase/thioredoxin
MATPTSHTGSKTSRRAARQAAARRRTRNRWLLGLGAVALIIATVAVAVGTSGSSAGKGITTADAFDLPRLGASGRVTLAAHRGTPTVVNMFATWCDQCDRELPGFHDLASRLKGRVDFIFVNSNETGNWRSMAERHGLLDFEVAADVGGTAGNGLYRSFGGAGGMPLTAFYDANGALLRVVPGTLVGSDLTNALDELYGVGVA